MTSPAPLYPHRHLLGIEGLSHLDIEALLDRAEDYVALSRQVEKKAATAPLRMLFPLMLFILPALFITVMGPAVITIGKMFKTGFGG